MRARIRNVTNPTLDAELEALRVPVKTGERIKSFAAVAREALELGVEQLKAHRAQRDVAKPPEAPEGA